MDSERKICGGQAQNQEEMMAKGRQVAAKRAQPATKPNPMEMMAAKRDSRETCALWMHLGHLEKVLQYQVGPSQEGEQQDYKSFNFSLKNGSIKKMALDQVKKPKRRK